ncbi:hypothetical protein KR018_001315 [Drosophila ironensis]|nr:hypothetical protein KR018_001315 [Drosophila ironensis]
MMFNIQAKIVLQPLVLFQVLNSYERRPKDATQIMGTLLGRTNGKGQNCTEVIITNCFTVLHKEHADGGRLELDFDYANDMQELNQLTYPQERVLGWFSTGKAVSKSARLLHEYYTRECSDGQPLHLLVDATLKSQRMATRLYCAVEMGVPGGTKGLMFSLLPFEIATDSHEMVALRVMLKQAVLPTSKQVSRIVPELVQVAESTRDLQQRLDLVLRYINDVLTRRRRPDNSVGRALHDTLTSVPMVDADNFRVMFNANVRDMLMAITLSAMIKTQLQISEKLSGMNDH